MRAPFMSRVRRGPRAAGRTAQRAAASLALLLLAGCSDLKVDDLADGRHALTSTSPSGDYYGSREEAVDRANEYCHRYKQTAVIERFEDEPVTGLQSGRTTRVVFTCVESPVQVPKPE